MTIWDDWKQLAEPNGINRKTFECRIWNYGWTYEEAATIPKNKKRDTEYRKWLKVALANGIKESTYRSRMYNYGFTKEEAATRPLRRVSGLLKS